MLQRMKNWQAFLLFYGPLLLMVLLGLSILPSAIGGESALSLWTSYSTAFTILLILVVVSGIFSAVWLYQAGNRLSYYLPEDTDLNLSSFQTNFLLLFLMPFFYILFSLIPFLGIILNLLLVIGAFVLAFKVYGYVGKALVSVEKEQGDVPQKYYAGEMLMFYMLFLGIWFVQPRLNDIFNESDDDETAATDMPTPPAASAPDVTTSTNLSDAGDTVADIDNNN
jgi:uncharacterized membrane protein